jgi:hypothetical protein
MKRHLSILGALVMAVGAAARGQQPVPPAAPATVPQAKPDAPTELKGIAAPYLAAVESVSADYQKWIIATEAWYLAELDKLQNARAKLGDLEGALATKAERERIASHAPTPPEQIQAMPQSLRAQRAAFDQGMKRNMDAGTQRIDLARRKYLADLESLQNRLTIAGDLDKALIVKTEKERFIAELAAGTNPLVSLPPQPPPIIATNRGVPPAATTLGATKASPFVNTLGMEFVPVPGTKVLFCRWQTRVKDYAEFAKEKTVSPSWKTMQFNGVPVGREPEHPVSGMSWDEAKEFCEWLTKKESAEGKLPKGMQYRLPTDEEWSQAVGLAKENGATPRERSMKNMVDYPWGAGWPPRAKVGNYGDETFHEKFPNAPQKWIEGYTDGFITTSPVGTFPANDFGIHDLGGNLYQWCDDWYDPVEKSHVTRGCSWANSDRFSLLLSRRSSLPPGSRSPNVGFRCVVEPSAQ